MTSYENHDATVNHFRENNFFGGHQDSFVFFPQSMLPAVDENGKIMMASQSSLKLAPNGNGALFDSLKSNREVQGLISVLDYVQIIGVDNALNKVLDPVQIGYTHNQNLQASLKCVAKRNAAEKVGVVGTRNGKYDVVEYSELPEEMANETNADGSLRFSQGSIVVFVVQADFLIGLAHGTGSEDSDATSLYHRAHKKIAHVDPDTNLEIIPNKENGWKFELFIYSLLPRIQKGRFGVVTVDRADEFAPVKNADGDNG